MDSIVPSDMVLIFWQSKIVWYQEALKSRLETAYGNERFQVFIMEIVDKSNTTFWWQTLTSCSLMLLNAANVPSYSTLAVGVPFLERLGQLEVQSHLKNITSLDLN